MRRLVATAGRFARPCVPLATSSSRLLSATAATSSTSSSHHNVVRDEFTRQSQYIEEAGSSINAAWYTNAAWFVQSAFRHPLLAPYHRHAATNPNTNAYVGAPTPPSLSKPLPQLKVLEVAAGTGILSRTLATDIAMSHEMARGRVSITGVDLTPAMLAQGRQQALQAGLQESQLKLMEGNALSLPFPDQSFDVVMTRWFLHHVPTKDVPQAMKEMARVLKHGGIFSHRSIFEHQHIDICC
jgi:SAM-dependent methyltransferase